ncbi:hypothetical protein EYF80_019532 [Liparis tanakae]|uniref:Uncharacterized protein n=1 Tax=Liparis tanakae TaxID=230148 RepID=A0A4Z2HXC6_9TELE|nr:hypothetical protein EYF80_019532 [Liparis tanakae]
MGNNSLQGQQHKWLLVTTEGAIEAAEAQRYHAIGTAFQKVHPSRRFTRTTGNRRRRRRPAVRD